MADIPVTITFPCRVQDCWTDVRGDTRCSEHGGKPLMESRTDVFGNVRVVNFSASQEEPNATTAQ